MTSLKLSLLCFSALISVATGVCMDNCCPPVPPVNAGDAGTLDVSDLYEGVMNVVQSDLTYVENLMDRKPFTIKYNEVDVDIVPKDGFVFDVVFQGETLVKRFSKIDFGKCKRSFSSPLGVGNRIDPADSVASSHIKSEMDICVTKSIVKDRSECEVKFLFDHGLPRCFELVKSSRFSDFKRINFGKIKPLENNRPESEGKSVKNSKSLVIEKFNLNNITSVRKDSKPLHETPEPPVEQEPNDPRQNVNYSELVKNKITTTVVESFGSNDPQIKSTLKRNKPSKVAEMVSHCFDDYQGAWTKDSVEALIINNCTGTVLESKTGGGMKLRNKILEELFPSQQ